MRHIERLLAQRLCEDGGVNYEFPATFDLFKADGGEVELIRRDTGQPDGTRVEIDLICRNPKRRPTSGGRKIVDYIRMRELEVRRQGKVLRDDWYFDLDAMCEELGKPWKSKSIRRVTNRLYDCRVEWRVVSGALPYDRGSTKLVTETDFFMIGKVPMPIKLLWRAKLASWLLEPLPGVTEITD